MSIDYGPPSMSLENIVPPTNTDTIKVYSYVDDDPTPFKTTLQTATGYATLGDFKKADGRKGFKYFVKMMDNEIGMEVKVELTEEECKLTQSQNRLYELFLLSSNGANGGTLQRRGHAGTLPRRMGTDRNHRDIQPQRGYHGHPNLHGGASSAGEADDCASSRPGTLISRRAGEGLAECYTSASEQPYRYDDSRLSYSSSAMEGGMMGECNGDISRRRKPRKNRFRKGYVPSTIGSQPESSGESMSLPRILEVKLQLFGPDDILGISVVSVEGSILVSDVFPGGAIARDARIDVGDQIVQVNKHSFENLSDIQAIKILRKVAMAKKPLTLYVAKRCIASDGDPLSTLASETMPLDISLWVENAVHCTERQRFGVDGVSSIVDRIEDGGSPCTEDEEEERILYAERRNGAPRRIIEEMERRKRTAENDANDIVYMERLHSKMDPVLIVQTMAQSNSGLQVKNRKWLKIPVPHSFIGREMVQWLQKHVDDLHDRKAAREFAALLLRSELIKHVVSKLAFTEKCYYVFNEMIVPRTLSTGGAAESTQTSGGTGREGGATEVTYLGSPAIAPRVAHNETWPFSPITVVHKNGGAAGRRADCESDYASMVGGGECSSLLPLHRQPPPPNTPLSAGSTINDTI